MRKHSLEVIDAFSYGARGPDLKRWLHFSDLLFSPVGADSPDEIVGAQVGEGWVVLDKVQVVQVTSEEAHSFWHRRLPPTESEPSNVWRIDESDWLKSFKPRHLGLCHHYVLEFYDHVLEAVAEALIFGPGAFELEEAISHDGRLGYAYLHRAMRLEKEGRSREAESSYVAYLATDPSEGSPGYAERCLEHLRKRL